ncbi:right-handed parallel beta-helix repeat-containing protein [Candidatus Saccharibacteria bacterium]|nr:right-handed parallel beta-helix repeat-containing protein [Candidatus Saccharibacteria bacterium]
MASNVIDEDDMVSDSDTKVPTQQSVKAYVTTSMAGAGAGDVVGPASSTDNALARFDSTTGKIVQDSNATLSDSGDLKLTANRYLQADNIEPSSSGSLNFVGKSGTSAYEQGSVVINGGINAGTGDGGSIKLQAGQAMGGGANGAVKIGNTSGYYASLDVSAMTADRTVTLPNADVNLSGGTDGDVLTVQADGSLAVETPSAGGGGQTTYDAIVATSGGTHTTLGAAIAAASNGHRILVLDSTTETGDITTALTGLSIIGGSKGSVVDLSTYRLTISGTNAKLENLNISTTTGGVWLSGTYAHVDSCIVSTSAYASTSSGTLYLSGNGAKLTNSTILNTATTGTAYATVRSSGDKIEIVGNYFSIPAQGTTATAGSIFSSSGVLFSNNTVDVSTGSTNAYLISLSGDSSICSDNRIQANASIYAIYSTGLAVNISNNSIRSNFIRGIWYTGTRNVITGNNLFTGTASAYGIYCGASQGNINGNTIGCNNGTSDICIYVNSAVDDTTIVGNYAYYASVGVKINASTCDRTLVIGNHLGGPTTDMEDSGTGTVAANNIT